jgi:hypothetical protein
VYTAKKIGTTTFDDGQQRSQKFVAVCNFLHQCFVNIGKKGRVLYVKSRSFSNLPHLDFLLSAPLCECVHYTIARLSRSRMRKRKEPLLFCCLGIGDISCDVSWKTGKIRRGNKRIRSSPWAYKEKSLCTQPVIHSCLLRQSLFDTRPTVLIIDGSNFLFCIYSNMTGRRRRIRATVRGE